MAKNLNQRTQRGTIDNTGTPVTGFSIQAKLLVMLLLVTVISTVVVGSVGSITGSDSLRDAAYQRLTAVRESRAREITSYFNDASNSLVVYTRGRTTHDAATAFSNGFKELQSSTLSQAENARVDDYYRSTFAPALEKHTAVASDGAEFTPTSPAQRYLQSEYTVSAGSPAQALANDDAGDGSAWSAANALYNDYFRQMVVRAGFEDALLIDPSGTVVYSAAKGVDLGTNLSTGPYKSSALATTFTSAIHAKGADFVGISDFERYTPTLNVPAMWIESPIGKIGAISGVLALKVPIAAINKIMTGDQQWVNDGLGETGEVFLAGSDGLMRSISRQLVEDPSGYEKNVVGHLTPAASAARAVNFKGTVLLQPVDSYSVQQALAGRTGTSIEASYLGSQSIEAYAPLTIPGLHWAIVARIDSTEAFAPINDFILNLVIWSAGVIVLVCLLSLLLAQIFVAPLRRLMDAVRRVAAGERDVQAFTDSRDEFAQVAAAFNDMSSSLQVKTDLLEQEREENGRLIETLMPEALARRIRSEDKSVEHRDVSVIFADIVGFDEFSRGVPASEAEATLEDIFLSFDEAAARHGIDRVRTTRRGYLASCGFVTPRSDHAGRVVGFALEVQQIVQRFNSNNGENLHVRAGLDSGAVTVGGAGLAFDMWGDALNLAYRPHEPGESADGIFLTQDAVDALPETADCAKSGSMVTQTGEQNVWRISPTESHSR
jgi:class 3 adenylate cyclase